MNTFLVIVVNIVSAVYWYRKGLKAGRDQGF